MNTVLKGVLAALSLAALGLGIAIWTRNPEHLALDDAARKGASGLFVSLPDGITHYDVSGPDTGQRVVLVHGFSVPYYIFDSTATALAAAGFRVARYDHFGRGFSDRPDVDYTTDLLDRQLSGLLDSLGWTGPVDLVGLSMGGLVVAAFAGRHPDRVRSLVLVDPAAGPASGLPWYFTAAVLGPALWQIMAVPGMADGQRSDFTEPAKWPDWPDRYRVQMQYRGFGRALRSSRLHMATLASDTLYARIGALGTRSLLIWGKEDQTVPFALAEQVRKGIPQAEFLPVDQTGHLPHMERANIVNPALISFLRGPAGSDSTSARKP